MGKDAARRRAWVKNAAIIFLAFLLVLTLFSNTIMNYSLPEISAQYAKYGTISNAIKLSGTVKSNASYSVVYDEAAAGDDGTAATTQTRKVVSVYVKVGDTVALGDPILALQGGASAELEDAEKKLAEAEQAYELALLQDDVTSLTSGQTLTEAEQAIADAKAELDKLNALYAKLLAGTDTTGVIKEQIKALEKSVKSMTKEKSAADSKITELEGKIATENQKIEEDFSGVSLADRLRLATEEASELELQVYALKDALEVAKETLNELKGKSDNVSDASSIASTIESLEKEIESLEKTVSRAREDFADKLKSAAKKTTTGSTNADSEDDTGDESGASTQAKTAYLKDLSSSTWSDLEKAVLRSYDWEDIYDHFESILKKALLKEIPGIVWDDVKDEVAEYIDDVASMVKAHKRSMEDYDEDINAKSKELSDAQEKLKLLGFDVGSTDSLVDYEMQQRLDAAQKEYDNTSAELTEVTTKYEEAKTSVKSLTEQNQSSEKIAEYEKALDEYDAVSEELEKKLEEANDQLDKLNDDLADAEEGTSQKPEDVLTQIEDKKNEITAKETSLAIAKATGTADSTKTEYEREAQRKEIEELKAKVEAYKNAPETTDVAAPIAGRIVSVNYVPGESVSSGNTVAQIEISDKGYVCEISVASDEARKIQVGSTCTITNSWRYNDVSASVTQVRNDPQSQGKQRIVVIEVTGDVYDGQSLTFSIGDKSQSYDSVLPNSAIREDSDGKFVLVVESKKTPLGVRYTAVRYDVTIVASDDTQSAVSGLYGNEFVIINTTQPVSDGQYVRLADK